MKGIQQIRSDRRRKATIRKIENAGQFVVQTNGALFGAMGTTKLRTSTMGVSRAFEGKAQRKNADALEQWVLVGTLAVAGAQAAAKGYTNVKSRMAERAYDKAMADQARVEEPTEVPKPAKRPYTKRRPAGSKA